MVLYELAGFIISAIVLVKAGSYAVKAITAIGKNLKIAGFVISFFLVGLVSAFPEGFISVISAFKGVPSLGFGTLAGSVIADLSLVIGLVAIVSGRIKFERGLTSEIWLFGLLLLMLALASDGTISRVDGAILIGSTMLFFYTLIQKNHLMDGLMHSDKKHFAKDMLIFSASAAAVFISASYMVKFSMELAADFEVPLVVVGLILLALATSIPETVFALAAARKKLANVAIGELFGVIIMDGALLIGLVALIHPIAIPAVELTKIAVFALTSAALATYFIRSNYTLTWKEGVVLIFFYILFIITELTSERLIPT